MKVHFTFRKIDENSKQKLEQCFYSNKLNRLTKLLNHSNLELADLDIKAEYFTKHNAFFVKIGLQIKKHNFVGEEASHDIMKACDLAMNRLMSQLKKYKQ